MKEDFTKHPTYADVVQLYVNLGPIFHHSGCAQLRQRGVVHPESVLLSCEHAEGDFGLKLPILTPIFVVRLGVLSMDRLVAMLRGCATVLASASEAAVASATQAPAGPGMAEVGQQFIDLVTRIGKATSKFPVSHHFSRPSRRHAARHTSWDALF